MAAISDAGTAYDPDRCDLCGSRRASTLLHLDTGRALRSDRVVLPAALHKLECADCGLVRDGRPRGDDEIAGYYASEYALVRDPAQHVFHTRSGPVTRSRMIADWLLGLAAHRVRGPRRGLEVGASAGHLLEEMQRLLPEATLEGIEPGEDAAAAARARGLNVRTADLADLPEAAYDFAWSIAVVEHVASPARFLAGIRRCLRPGGWLLLCQPTQDVPSYDVFFVDHLHHFGSPHLRGYATKSGFVERGLVVGHEWMPNFSLHLWQAAPPAHFAWEGRPAETTCRETAQRVRDDMARLDATLESLRGRRTAVFGLREVYALARAYSTLDGFPFACGLDDEPERAEYAALPFPVVAPERAPELGVEHAILAVNRVYHDQVAARLGALGIAAHPILS